MTSLATTDVNSAKILSSFCIDGSYYKQYTTVEPISTNISESYVETSSMQEYSLNQPLKNTETTAVVRLFALIILYSLVFLFGTFGNFLVIVTLRSSPQMRTVTNCFLFSLAISDMLQALICTPLTIIGQTLQRFIFGEVLCKLFYYIMGISVSVSTFTMLAISMERYHAICKPLKSRGWQTKSHAYKVIGAIWLISVVCMSPYVIYAHIRFYPVEKDEECKPSCRLSFKSYDQVAKKFWSVFMLVALLLLPGIIMIISYLKICRQIYKGFQFKSNPATSNLSMKIVSRKKVSKKSSLNENEEVLAVKLSSSRKHNLSVSNSGEGTMPSGQLSQAFQSKRQFESKKKIIRMLIVVVIFFFVCWTPLLTVNVWKGFDEKSAVKYLSKYIIIIQFLSYVSTCINPIIYCFMNLKFRQSFVKKFMCCLPKRCVNKVQENRTTATNVDRTMTSEVNPPSVLSY